MKSNRTSRQYAVMTPRACFRLLFEYVANVAELILPCVAKKNYNHNNKQKQTTSISFKLGPEHTATFSLSSPAVALLMCPSCFGRKQYEPDLDYIPQQVEAI